MNPSISVCIYDSMQNVGDRNILPPMSIFTLKTKNKSPCAEFSQTRTRLHLRLNTSSTTVYKTTFAWKTRVISIITTRSSSETQGVHPPSMISNHLRRVFRITDEATGWTFCTFSTCSIPNTSRNNSINATQPLGSRVKTSLGETSHSDLIDTNNNYTVTSLFFYRNCLVVIPLNPLKFKVPARFWSTYSKIGLTRSHRDERSPAFLKWAISFYAF